MAENVVIGYIMWLVFPPILILLGTAGNILAIVTLSRRNLYRAVSSSYLLALSLSDLMVLHTGLLSLWVGRLLKVSPSALPTPVCKGISWIVYTSGDSSVWIVVAITTERVIATVFPYSYKMKCTRVKAFVAITTIVLTSLAINSHFLFGMGVRTWHYGNVTITVSCSAVNDIYQKFLLQTLPVLNFCKTTLLPFLIIFFGSVAISTKLASSRFKRMNSVVPLNTGDTEGPSKIAAMTKLMALLNLAFVTFKTPIAIYLILGADVLSEEGANDPLWVMVNVLFYTNHTLNFLMYCVSGPKFRKEVRLWCKGGASQGKANVPSTMVTTVSPSRGVDRAASGHQVLRKLVMVPRAACVEDSIV